ncbi:MAG TPA: prenyltransferase, partial [Galbitalea sp.]
MFKALFVSSRPLSWVNTAFPFAAAYLITTG